MAAAAVALSTPSISNNIFPGRITATHCSGAPLPLPIRVSAGFLVIGLSGNKRIHTLPPRLMERVMATRAASICRSVIQAHSSAFKPKSPKEMDDPRQALPHMRPRCCFLYLTFFGIIMAVLLSNPYSLSAGFSAAGGAGASTFVTGVSAAGGASALASCFHEGDCGDINGGRIGAPVRAAGRGRSAGGACVTGPASTGGADIG